MKILLPATLLFALFSFSVSAKNTSGSNIDVCIPEYYTDLGKELEICWLNTYDAYYGQGKSVRIVYTYQKVQGQYPFVRINLNGEESICSCPAYTSDCTCTWTKWRATNEFDHLSLAIKVKGQDWDSKYGDNYQIPKPR